MSLPRDLTGRELAALLRRHFGYEVVRQTGSHRRLATSMGGEHRVTGPAGGPLRVGTLAAILSDVA
ncbi:MAG: type II toxin-antitoxin system HicA family toxin, partial [Acidimicrobiales bacterium]